VRDLTKEYRGGVKANDGISLTVAAGEVFGLFGHNGAGKTTLLNQVAGLTLPTSGTIRVDGVDPVADPARARQLCSLQPQANAPLAGMTPRQAIETLARIRGARRDRARERAAELIAALELQEWADRAGDRLSGGVWRLTAFCMAAVVSGRRVVAQVAPSAAAAALGWAQGWRDAGQVDEFSVTPTSLEDVYLALVGGSGQEERDAAQVA
jgi:ABC-2 type transport system ATP-binding protein